MNHQTRLKLGISALALLGVGLTSQALADEAPAKPAAKDAAHEETVVITGFRASLQSALSTKRRENSMVDVIKSDDIAQFPDLNLAESIQRVPGVSIDRDGGEGRSITVRGLNSDFTRVRLNGMEAQATTGGKDSSGGANRGRGFDFNVFAAELFNSITVRKSMEPQIEEGSLGATVDLQVARPFDYKGFAMGGGLEGGYNDLSKKNSGRGSFLVSNRWADGKLGALLSVAYGHNTLQEEGPNTTRWENNFSPSTIGRVASYSLDGGTTFISDCLAATASGVCAPAAGGSAANLANSLALNNALHPRIPRYSRFVTDQTRLGVTGSFQMRPTPDTLVTLDTMYAKYDANRDEYDLEAIGPSRSGAGYPASSIYNYTIDSSGTITKASYNKMDIRAEHRFDRLATTFKQIDLSIEQKFGEKLTAKLLIGGSDSFQNNPEQTTFTWDAYDVNGYSYDFTNSRHPVFNYGTKNGCTVDQACYWSYSPNLTATSTAATSSANGGNPGLTSATAVASTGDASLIRIRPQSVDNRFNTAKIDFNYDINDIFKLKAGASHKTYGFFSTEFGRVTVNPATRDEAANNQQAGGLVSLLSGNIAQYSQSVTLAGNTFLVPNLDLIRATTQYNCRCVNSYGVFTVNNTNSSSRANNRDAHEADTSSYVQADFDHILFGMPVRGNLGVRYVKTEESVDGMVGSTPVSLSRSYNDVLPSGNVSIQVFPNFYLRAAAAKTMARPTLQSLTPGGSITTSTQTFSTGNPFLNPVRANTQDLSLEWYPTKDSLFSAAVFRKDITSYIQTLATYEPFSQTGFDLSLLSGTGQDGNTLYLVTQPVNTPGGKLQGYEVNLQSNFSFLPGFLKNFGGIANYTHVTSNINYIVSSTSNALTHTVTNTYRLAPLVGLSPESFNLTLYYSQGPFEARISEAYRSSYISIVLPGSGADFQGKTPTRNVDAQVTYQINKNFTLLLEGINLTDQHDDRNDQYNTAQGNTGQNLLLDNSHPGRQYYVGLRFKY